MMEEFRGLRWRKGVRFAVLCCLALSVTGCLNSPLSVSNTEWTCKEHNSKQVCQVEFELKNSSYEEILAEVLIQAHRRRFGDIGNVTNIVVRKKILSLSLKGEELLKVKESLHVPGAVTQIVVTAIVKQD